MSATILAQPDLAKGETLPAPKQRKCVGCGAPWIAGHACQTPAVPPTTPRHWRRPGETRLYVSKPNSEGQFVLSVRWKCGHETLECTRSVEVRDRLVNDAAEALCYRCDRVQGECDRA